MAFCRKKGLFLRNSEKIYSLIWDFFNSVYSGACKEKIVSQAQLEFGTPPSQFFRPPPFARRCVYYWYWDIVLWTHHIRIPRGPNSDFQYYSTYDVKNLGENNFQYLRYSIFKLFYETNNFLFWKIFIMHTNNSIFKFIKQYYFYI